eukprot:2997327-Prymnesium_polylepis.3
MQCAFDLPSMVTWRPTIRTVSVVRSKLYMGPPPTRKRAVASTRLNGYSRAASALFVDAHDAW